jgi:2-iminobutanoate/2-iminopropanoate deaminase
MKKLPRGTAPILYPADPHQQCNYACEKIKKSLGAHGADISNVVKQVVYVTDVRYLGPVARCRQEEYGAAAIPANTFVVVSGLAIQGMLLEIDVTAVAPE